MPLARAAATGQPCGVAPRVAVGVRPAAPALRVSIAVSVLRTNSPGVPVARRHSACAVVVRNGSSPNGAAAAVAGARSVSAVSTSRVRSMRASLDE